MAKKIKITESQLKRLLANKQETISEGDPSVNFDIKGENDPSFTTGAMNETDEEETTEGALKGLHLSDVSEEEENVEECADCKEEEETPQLSESLQKVRANFKRFL